VDVPRRSWRWRSSSCLGRQATSRLACWLAITQTKNMGTTIFQFMVGHQAQIWSLVTVIVAALVTRILRLRPRLRYSVGHSANLLVMQPLLDENGKQIADRQIVRTASITLDNGGLQAAKSLEVTFNWKPPILNIWPARAFNESNSSFDRYSLKFDSLAPYEQLTIEIMSINQELPSLTVVRSEDCVGKMVHMSLQRVWPSWFNNSVGVALLFGCATLIYLFVVLIRTIAG
jgi:hypothetical protein